MSVRSRQQPWPLKWILVVIIVFVLPYTWLNLRYRKAGPAHEPYEDAKNQANVHRLLAAGYRRIPLQADAQADTAAFAATLAQPADLDLAPGGLPSELAATLVDEPALPLGFAEVAVSRELDSQQEATLHVVYELADPHAAIVGGFLYIKDQEVVIVPTVQRGAGRPAPSTRAAVRLTLPGGLLPAGTHRVLLTGERQSAAWTWLVK